MKSLHIEWQHIEKDGKTCRRCAETGTTLAQVIKELAEELTLKGISVSLTETKLSKEEVSESNRLFFNGTALEDVLPDVSVSENPCSSCADVCGCGDLCGTTVNCRTVVSEGVVYEDIPASLIRRAALQAVAQQAK
ncbi:MAG TPA: DUF2703 domain-containing protein [Nitrospirales bacterium]|nr:DUF2703 domain-containing protein [Nitrospirales bacterium]